MNFRYAQRHHKCIIYRYGHCSEYIWENDICRGSFRTGIDYVYVKSALGNQSTISNLLNSLKKEAVGTFENDHDKDCEKEVFRVFCHYYLPPCGNSASPSSICQEECQMVQDRCQRIWHSVFLAFKTIDPVLDCSDTSKFLFPVPHCCTGAGLGMYTPFYSFPYSISLHNIICLARSLIYISSLISALNNTIPLIIEHLDIKYTCSKSNSLNMINMW